LAGAVVDRLPAPLTRALHRRLVIGGLYADERWIESALSSEFVIETLDRFASDVHLHGRVVARKR
jgi:hypothetical protein